ncbi:hypothetical protein [Pseudorhizobium pelagicum]|uniref:Uncharacterized protein n=1 Tax=Pseudorhizobium pelagicum TaxID=1509405 RepID=A0A922T5F1_9HYPH|nr:hypothetical protein [Pseudorhizobium pelagicum]KEQ05727.1 hypothetical protein GV67_03995 [Pseudorhizobium pelagicum]KEQ06407.1 hypothetical protein GV68_06990 [Pseudorhizobium pelagicum]
MIDSTLQLSIGLAFDAHDVKLPLERSNDCIATIVDASGRDVLTLDVNNERPDSDIEILTELVLNIINASAGGMFAAGKVAAERTS